MGNIDLTDIDERIVESPFSHLARLDELYIGSELTSENQITFLKSLGIETAIDMKEVGESDFPDKEALEKAGIQYFHFPVSDITNVEFEKLLELTNILRGNKGKKILYCISGNRVAAVLALQQSLVCGHPKLRAYEVACRVGMTKEMLKEKVYKILKGVEDEEPSNCC